MQGAIGQFNIQTPAVKTEKVFKPRPFDKPTRRITAGFYQDYLEKYGVLCSYLNLSGWRQIDGHAGIVIPLYDQDYSRYGVTTKFWDQSQKAIHYLEREYHPPTHFPPYPKPSSNYSHATTRAVIVEDAISALKVQYTTGIQAIALLGTSFKEDRVRLIRKAGYDRIILWLDPDAREKAVEMRNKYGLFFEEFQVFFSEKDPKDTESEKIRELFSGYLV